MGDGWHSMVYGKIVCPECGHEHNRHLPVMDSHAPFVFKCESCGKDFEVACFVEYRARTINTGDDW